jgi:hypothetical protein
VFILGALHGRFMKDALKRICELQPSYSAANTPEMQERGAMLRGEVKPAIESMRPFLAETLGRFGDDFHVDASDGIGRKTELPWVRFCSKGMSPSPTEGFYCVVHFSTDGSAVHVTVGCGSSRFHKGSSVPLPDSELDAQTAWARGVVTERQGTLAPFTDVPDFGARRPLPVSFQRATAMSKRVAYEDIDGTNFEQLFDRAADRLRLIYDAQSTGRDLTQADQAEAEIVAAIDPIRTKGLRQGYGLPAAARRAVEMRAMEVAEQWLRSDGYSVKDCSLSQPFDFEAVRGADALKVEVKGTTSDRTDAILMTSNEVELHRAQKGLTALIIVARIRLVETDGKYSAEGGEAEVLLGWDIADWELEPTAYRVTRK